MEADAWVASSGNHQPSVAFSLQSVGKNASQSPPSGVRRQGFVEPRSPVPRRAFFIGSSARTGAGAGRSRPAFPSDADQPELNDCHASWVLGIALPTPPSASLADDPADVLRSVGSRSSGHVGRGFFFPGIGTKGRQPKPTPLGLRLSQQLPWAPPVQKLPPWFR